MTVSDRLVVIETHPVQYHAPVYRAVQRLGLPVTAIYGSDFSVAGYRDREFGATFAWDTDLLSGYHSVFLSRSRVGEAGAVSTRGLWQALREARPAAILLVGYSPRFFRRAIVQALRTGCPLLFRAETTDHGRPRAWWKRLLRDSLLRSLYGRCGRLLYVGQRSRDHFRRLHCPDDRLVFSPYCVDVAAFHPGEADREQLRDATRMSLGVSPGQKVVLFSGKLSQRKGVDLLVDAVRRLPPKRREETLVVFLGSGELRDDLEKKARMSPAVAVRFAGFQNQSRLSAFYHAADLLALPSLQGETWGLVVNEALHHGVPAVVSAGVGCGPDLVEPGVTGEVCATGSADELASAIERAMGWMGTEGVRERCRARVGAYSVERAAEGIAHAYRSVTSHVTPPRSMPCS
jgi:glycosyltransferase involved in cell wall biosynthesis